MSSEADQLNQQGNTYFQNIQYEQAIQTYTKSLAIREAANVYCNRSFAHLKLGRYMLAYYDAHDAMFLEPSNVKAHYRKCLALSEKGEHAFALDTLRQSLVYFPTNVDLQRLYSDILQVVHQSGAVYHTLMTFSTGEGPLFSLFKKKLENPVPEQPVPFTSWKQLGTHIAKGNNKFSSLYLEELSMDKRAMDFFGQVDPACFHGSSTTFLKVDFSGFSQKLFNELFGWLQPALLVFSNCTGLAKYNILQAMNCLPALQTIHDIKLFGGDLLFSLDQFVDSLHGWTQPRMLVIDSRCFDFSVQQLVHKLRERFSDPHQASYFLRIFCPKRDVNVQTLECRAYNPATNQRFKVNCSIGADQFYIDYGQPTVGSASSNVTAQDFVSVVIRSGL